MSKEEESWEDSCEDSWEDNATEETLPEPPPIQPPPSPKEPPKAQQNLSEQQPPIEVPISDEKIIVNLPTETSGDKKSIVKRLNKNFVLSVDDLQKAGPDQRGIVLTPYREETPSPILINKRDLLELVLIIVRSLIQNTDFVKFSQEFDDTASFQKKIITEFTKNREIRYKDITKKIGFLVDIINNPFPKVIPKSDILEVKIQGAHMYTVKDFIKTLYKCAIYKLYNKDIANDDLPKMVVCLDLSFHPTVSITV